jgi:hypothetical protein
MDKQRATDSLPADLGALREELTHLHAEAKMAVSQRCSEASNDQGGIVVRGR